MAYQSTFGARWLWIWSAMPQSLPQNLVPIQSMEGKKMENFNKITILLIVFLCTDTALAATWTETSFDDFADGRYSDGAANIYTSIDGTIRLVGQQWDVNGDGWMDIVFSNSRNDITCNINSYIYFGSAGGFSSANRAEVETHGAVGNSIADLNNDGYLDIVFSSLRNDTTYDINSFIYWGSNTGFSNENRTELQTHAAYGNSISDLNGDGYLDIVFSNFYDGTTWNVNSFVYWGSEAGFSNENRTELQTHGASENSVSDLNGDGYLDIVFSNRRNNTTHNINSFIYWGSEAGFSNENRTELQTHGTNGNSVSDLNGDGCLDIVFSNFYDGTTHNINSFVYWGSETGFSEDNRAELETHGAFLGTTKDLGDVYNRGREIVYTSSVYDTDYLCTFVSISWVADTPSNTAVEFQIKSAKTEAELATALWYGPTSTDDCYTASDTLINPIHNDARFVQYRATFLLSNPIGLATPKLHEISISYTYSTDPDIVVNPNQIDFGDVPAGLSRNLILTIANQGAEDLAITDITSDDNRLTVSPSSFTLTSHQSQQVNVRFAPTDEFALSATLTIESTDPDEGTLEIPVTGWGVGYVNRALSLDGDGDYVNIDDSDVFTLNDLSISVWIKIPPGGSVDGVVHSWTSDAGSSEWFGFQESDGKIVFNVDDGIAITSVTAATNVKDNVWHHIVGVRDEDQNMSIFVDGVLEASTAETAAQINPENFHIGKVPGFSRYVDGTIDEVRIWNYARTQEEIQATMHLRLTGNEPGLVGYWRFDEEPGTPTAHDSSPNANDGTLFGNASFVESDAPIALRTVEPNIMVSPTELDFGDVAVRTFEERTLTVINTGEQALHVTDIAIDNNYITVMPYSFSLAMGQEQEVRVRYAPRAETPLSATLTIESNDPDEGLVEVVVTGQGVPYQNRALSLDGVDDYVGVADNDILDIGTSDFTISFWIKMNTADTTNGYRLICKRTGVIGYEIYINPSETDVEIFIGDSGGYIHELGTTTNIRDMAWHHIVVVFDRDGNATGYVDGTAEGARDISLINGSIANAGILAIGNSVGGGNEFYGKIDEVRIWNYARTEGQIRASMDLTLPGDTPGLVGYWRFDGQPSSKTAYDFTPNANHGALVGDAVFVDSYETFIFPSSQQDIDISPSSLNFGEVPVELVGEQKIFVRNIGRANLQVASISSDNAQFTASPQFFTLAMGEGVEVLAKFRPESRGGHTATFTIESNDLDEGALELYAAGFGVPYENMALKLDGEGDYVQVGHSELLNFDLGDSYTIEGWFNVAQDSILADANCVAQDSILADTNRVAQDSILADANRVAQDSILADADSKSPLPPFFKGGKGGIWATTSPPKSWAGVRADSWASSATTKTIIAKRAGAIVFPFDIKISSSGRISFFMQSEEGGASVGSEQALNDGSWHHFAVVKQGTESIYFFIDGNHVDSNTHLPESGSTQNTSDIFISWRGEGDNFFNGQLDEIRIWNAARTPAEIQANKDELQEGSANDLVAYWRFDEESGRNTADASHHGHDGALSGNANFVSVPWPHRPASRITEPKPGDYISGEISIIGTVTDINLQSWILEVASGAPPEGAWKVLAIGSAPVAESELAKWNTKSGEYPDGDYTLRLRVTDTGDNESVFTVAVIVDPTPPTVALQILSQGAEGNFTKNNASLSVSGQTEAGSAVTSKKVVDQNGAEVPGAKAIVNITPEGIITGTILLGELSAVTSVKLVLKVADRAKNEGEGSSGPLIVDNIPPTARILNPAHLSYFHVAPIKVSGSAFDEPSGVAKVEIDYGAGWVEATGKESWTYESLYPSAEKQFSLKVRATDKAGNVWESPQVIKVNFFYNLPMANISSPFDHSEVARGLVDIFGSAANSGNNPGENLAYILEYAQGADATSGWEGICQVYNTVVFEDLMCQWDTSGLKADTYTLRLRVEGDSKIEVKRRNITVGEPPSILYGDVNDDGDVNALDAACILQHIVGLRSLTPAQQTAGNVTDDNTLSALDAALILQYAVGLISSFPAESKNVAPSAKSPLSPLSQRGVGGILPLSQREVGGISQSDIVHLTLPNVTGKRDEVVKIPIEIDRKISGLLSGEITLTFDPSILSSLQVEPNKELEKWQILSQIDDGRICVAFAHSQAAVVEGNLFNIHFAVSKEQSSRNPVWLPSPLKLTRVQLNEGLIKTLTTPGTFEVAPEHSALLTNYPNPFNPETWIPYQLADAADVELRIYNINGQLVRTIHLGRKPVGTYASKSRAIHWDGRNEAGERAASGLYFYRLQAGKFRATRRMLIVK